MSKNYRKLFLFIRGGSECKMKECLSDFLLSKAFRTRIFITSRNCAGQFQASSFFPEISNSLIPYRYLKSKSAFTYINMLTTAGYKHYYSYPQENTHNKTSELKELYKGKRILNVIQHKQIFELQYDLDNDTVMCFDIHKNQVPKPITDAFEMRYFRYFFK
jgi:hypothetical protein